jgi:hypothetical protein
LPEAIERSNKIAENCRIIYVEMNNKKLFNQLTHWLKNALKNVAHKM